MRAKGEGKRKVRKKTDKRRKKGEKRKSGEKEERDRIGLQFLRRVTNTKTIRAKVEFKGTRYTSKTIKSLSNT